MITPAYATTATERILPKLALDFTTGVLDPRITFTRSLNTATRVNSSGFIETVNANLPRFDYDPVTLAIKGLLIEEARTNYALYSNDLTNAVWVATNMTTAKTATGPDNVANSATTITASANNATILQTITDASNARITSCYIKRRTGTGVINMTQDNGATWTAVTVTSNWTRVNIAPATLANPTIGLQITTSGDAIDVYGFQNERGTFITSVIPSTNATVTRNGDVAQMTGTNFSSWYNASEGSFVVKASTFSAVSTDKFIANANAGGFPNRFLCYFAATNNMAINVVTNSVGQQTMYSGGVVPLNTVSKATMAAKLNSFAISRDKLAPTTATSGTMPIGADRLWIGSATTTAFLNGHIQYIAYYPQRVLNAETQAFSG